MKSVFILVYSEWSLSPVSAQENRDEIVCRHLDTSISCSSGQYLMAHRHQNWFFKCFYMIYC